MRQIRVKPDLLIEELRNTLIFQNLSVDELKRIASICEHWEYAAGEEVLTQDSISRLLFVLLDGEVRVRRTDSTANTVTVDVVDGLTLDGVASGAVTIPANGTRDFQAIDGGFESYGAAGGGGGGGSRLDWAGGGGSG